MRTPLRRWVAAHRHREQRGAVAILMALVTCFVVIPVGAMAIDLGMQRIARRDMQAIADTTAIDMAARLAAGQSTTDGDARDANLSSGSLGATPALHTYVGYVAPGALESDQARGCGSSPYVGGFQDPSVAGKPANAILVTASTHVAFGLARALPGSGISSGGACRSSVAQAQSTACYELGSFAAGVNLNDSSVVGPLAGMLGIDSSAVSLASYQGIAGANISLAGISASPTFGTSDAVLAPSGVTVGDLIDASVWALQHQTADPNDPTYVDSTRVNAAVAGLQILKSSGLDLEQRVNIANVLGIDAGGSGALASSVNALDLLGNSIALANGDSFLSTGTTLAGVHVGATVIQRAHRFCQSPGNPTGAGDQSQVSVGVNIPSSGGLTGLVNAVTSPLGVTATATLGVDVQLGAAHAFMPGTATCGAGTTASPDSYAVTIQPQLTKIDTDLTVSLNGAVGLPPLVSVSFDHVTLDIGAHQVAPTVSQQANLLVPQNSINTTPEGTPKITGQTPVALSALGLAQAQLVSGSIKVVVAGLPLLDAPLTNNNVVTALAQLLGGVVGTVNSTVITPLNGLLVPLSNLLGIQVPGADVYSVYRPVCGRAGLIG